MKSISRLLGYILLSVACFSCNETVNQIPDQERSDIEEVVASSIKFKHYSSLRSMQENNPGISLVLVEFDGFGHGEQCRGFGLCHARWFPGIQDFLRSNTDGTDYNVNTYRSPLIESDNQTAFFMLLLEEDPDPNLSDSDLLFSIDSPIALPSNGDDELEYSRIILPGKYHYNSAYGDHGGYKIPVVPE